LGRLPRVGVFVLCLLPFLWLVFAAISDQMGPDPTKTAMLFTGKWSLRMLALTLLISPLRAWTGRSQLITLRRMLGLYAFFYACVHFLAFLQLYIGWVPAALAKELAKRPYITLGFSAWLLLLPLAITSTHAMQRRLRRNWQRLHRLVYPAAVLACLHLLWQARSDVGEALIYLAIFATLLLWRVRRRSVRQQRAVIART
jgi:methionine sulfoxide reductase heme-binding subunit